MKQEGFALILFLITLDPFSPPSWSLSFRPHTNTLTCPSWTGSVEAGFLLSARLCLAASSSSSNARNEKLAATSSSSAFARAVRPIPWILQSMPLLLHCRMPISKKRYSWNDTRFHLGLVTLETKTKHRRRHRVSLGNMLRVYLLIGSFVRRERDRGQD